MAKVARGRWALHSQLFLAIRTRDLTTAQEIFAAGVDVDTKFAIDAQKKPAILLSIENDDIEMVRLLLRLGASVNQSEALYVACSMGAHHIVQILLSESRPNINGRTHHGSTPLHAAVLSGSTETVEELIERKASLGLQDRDGRTPLHLAALGGNSDICRTLLGHGAPVGVLDNMNNTPLHYAVTKESESGGLDVIEDMIEQCPQAMCVTNKLGFTPLVIALRGGRSDVEGLLAAMLRLTMRRLPLRLFQPMVLEHRTELGQTPLQLAVEHPGCVRVLLAAGAEVNTRNNLGTTPLNQAAKDNHTTTLRLLLAAGAATRTLVQSVRNGETFSGLDDKIKEELLTCSRNPSSLSAICRRSLNRSVGLSAQLDHRLPHCVKQFLAFDLLHLH